MSVNWRPGHTVHLFSWVINHADCLRRLDITLDGLKARLDALAGAHAPLQPWHAQATWIPVFDRAASYEGTVYEEMSVLNFFRGILHEHQHGLKDWRMSAAWCGNVLRMVTPHLWLCRGLVEQLDKAALERVAAVTEQNGSTKVAKRPDCRWRIWSWRCCRYCRSKARGCRCNARLCVSVS
jgi:hypothetical protein